MGRRTLSPVALALAAMLLMSSTANALKTGDGTAYSGEWCARAGRLPPACSACGRARMHEPRLLFNGSSRLQHSCR